MIRPARVLALLVLGAGPAFAQEAKTQAKATAKPSIYDAKLDARAQVKAAGLKAARDNQRILVMFGGDWCGWCHKLHDLMAKDRAIHAALSENYQLVMVDTKAPNAEALLAKCQGDLKNVGFPFLAVLDADGTILTRQKTDPLEEGDHHDPAKVKAFLDQWAPPHVSATKAMDAALARAASEDKRIFLHFGAPWCGWCHKLDDFLARADIAPLVGKDFLDVKIDVDRMDDAKAVVAKYRKNASGGIPWFVFLDPKGEPIVNSDGPGGNIGYPAAPEEVAHFVAMLKKSAQRLTEDDIRAIETALKAEATKLNLGR